MGNLWRGWDSMKQPERIVAMSLAAGSIVGIVNSTVWAVAVCFMSYQKTRVRLAEVEARTYERLAAAQDAPIDNVPSEI